MVGEMAYEKLGGEALNYDPCEYPGSKLLFRGPQRRLKGNYVAFLGGTETYGRFIEEPFPALVEKSIGVPCVNFGWSNAGADVFLNDNGVLEAARGARTVVLQVPCAQNMSNRFYAVHPRRNDRFLEASPLMRQMFPEMDFTHFHFTRHLLGHLQRHAPRRFATLRKELQAIWISRMRLLVAKIGEEVVLLWFSRRKPGEENDSPNLSRDPALVSRPMIEAVRGHGTRIVEVCASPAAQAAGTAGMVYDEIEEAAATRLLGPKAHAEAALALTAVLGEMIK